MNLEHPLLNGPKRVHGKQQVHVAPKVQRLTPQLLDAIKTEKGGYDRQAVEKLGVAWPLTTGWKRRILGTLVIVEEGVKAEKPKKSKAKAEKVVMIDPNLRYTGPEPTSPEFDSRVHGLLAPPITTVRILSKNIS